MKRLRLILLWPIQKLGRFLEWIGELKMHYHDLKIESDRDGCIKYSENGRVIYDGPTMKAPMWLKKHLGWFDDARDDVDRASRKIDTAFRRIRRRK